MQPSIELENLILQLYQKLTSGRVLEFIKGLYSRRDGVLVIGSDPAEWLTDYESIIGFYEANGAAGNEINVDEARAFYEGAFGWVVDRVTVSLPDGNKVPVRHTYIFHNEMDEWKIVHAHISVAISNESIGA
jgi:hypothetical protein